MHPFFLLAAAPEVPSSSLAQRAQSLLGLVAFCLIAWLIGRARGYRKVPWRVVIWGNVLAIAFGAMVVYSPWLLRGAQDAIQKLLDLSDQGARMVFFGLLDPVPVTSPDGRLVGSAKIGFIFAVTVLSTIIFVSMLTAVLYHLGILTVIVNSLAWIMQKTMRTSGAETLSTAANIFVGQTEAPLFVRPFLAAATHSELMAIMVGGFANIASGVLVVYTQFLSEFVADAGGHLAAACFISAPATMVVSKLMLPETQEPVTAHGVSMRTARVDANLIDAATRGTSEGMVLAINVVAMLIAFTALVGLVNYLLDLVFRHPQNPITLQSMLSYPMAPLAWLTGVRWGDCREVGSLLGVKTVLNELVAYLQMREAFLKDPNFLSPRDALITTYALCGFANFASVGIQIGGISTMAPERRADLSRIGLLAMVGGALASLISASIVGILI